MSRYRKEQKDAAYRAYVTDSLQLIPQSRYITERFYDLLNKKVDARSGDDIARDVIKKAGLKVKNG